MKNKAKYKTAKVVKNSVNQYLISITKHAAVKLKNISDEIIAQVVVDDIKLTQFKKENEKLSEFETKKLKQKLNSNKNLPNLNTIKHFYLDTARLANISEVNYISSFKPEIELKRLFQYNSLPSSLSTRRIEISLPLIVHEHEYTEAETRDIL